MLQNAYFLGKIGADTAENEQHFAEIFPIGLRVRVLRREIEPNAAATFLFVRPAACQERNDPTFPTRH